MRRWGMTLRLFVILLLTGLCITVPFLWSYARETSRYLSEQNEREYQFMLSSANQMIEAYAGHIKGAMILISSNVTLQAREGSASLQTLLAEFAENNASSIHTLYYVPTEGKTLCSRQAVYDAVGNPMLDTLLAQATRRASFQWFPPYYSNMSGSVVVCMIPVRDSLRQITGHLIAECSYQNLLQQFDRSLLSDQMSYGLLTATGDVLQFDVTAPWIPQEGETYPPAPSATLLDHIQRQQLSPGDEWIDGKDLRIYQTQDNQLGWKLVLITNPQLWNVLSAQTRTFVVQTGSSILLGLLLLSLSLTWWLMLPLRKLVLHMRSIHSLEDLVPIGTRRTDEIGQLVESYDFMMESIQQLMQEIRLEESMRSAIELKMLRSQIGPHFLYNTLSCIASLARQGKADTVSKAIAALIELLSFSFDRQEEMVCLKDELKSLEAYVLIQHMRYGEDMFAYTVSCDATAGERMVPKLLLQPIVENAIFHGLLPAEQRACRIEISCTLQDRLILRIEDNGIGIPPDKLDRLLAGLESPLHDRFSSIGMANVAKRLHLRYGGEAQLRVESEESQGTCITITLPV